MGKISDLLHTSKETKKHKPDLSRQIGSVTLAAVLLPVAVGNVALSSIAAAQNHSGRAETAVWRASEHEEFEGITDKLTGITWNIHNGKTLGGKRNLSGVQTELQAKNADFVCLQEVRKSDAKKISESMPTYTGIYDPTYVSLLPNREPEGNLILVSTRVARPFELEVNSKQLYQKSNKLLPRSVTTVHIGANAMRSLVLFNTHLEAKDREANEKQAHEVNRYVVAHSGNSDVIGCADINAAISNSDTSEAITGETLMAWSPPKATYNNARIDGFFSSRRSFAATSMTVGTDRLSDHSMVTAVFNN